MARSEKAGLNARALRGLYRQLGQPVIFTSRNPTPPAAARVARRRRRVLVSCFHDFNRRFFGGRLPSYRIVLRTIVPGDGGFCDERKRVLRFSRACVAMLPAEELAALLIHEMAHARVSVWHGKTFQAEMKRLRDLGAPVCELDLLSRRARKR